MLFPSPSFRLASAVMLALCFGPLSAAQGDPAGLGCMGSWSTLDFTKLDTCRPKPVTDQEKQSLLASLPGRGEVRILNDGQKRKLSELDALLALHERKDVYVVKVIDVPQAWTGLYGREVLLISVPLLKLVSSGELQALVAHEIGHEYTWTAWNSAQAAGHKEQMHEIELTCDAIAFVTLQELGEDPKLLISALERVAQFNRGHFRDAIDQSSHPPLQERREVVKHLAEGRVRSIYGQQGNVVSLTTPSSSREKVSTMPAPKVKIKIAVYAFQDLDRSVVSSAEKVTTEIFKESHIEVEWLNCPGTHICDQPFESLQFRVAIHWQIGDVVKDSAQVKLMSEHDSLGFAIPCAVSDTVCLAYIFYSSINRLALMNGARVAVVLGQVMAHEIGHALLGPNPHSQTGIMRAKLPIADLERFLYFTSQQSERVVADLTARKQSYK